MRQLFSHFGSITSPQVLRSSGPIFALAVVVAFSALLLLMGGQPGGVTSPRLANSSASETPTDTPTPNAGDGTMTITPTGVVFTPTATSTPTEPGTTPTATPSNTPTDVPPTATPTNVPPTATPSETPVLPAFEMTPLLGKQATNQCVNGVIWIDFTELPAINSRELPFSVTVQWVTSIDGKPSQVPADDVTIYPDDSTFAITRVMEGYHWGEEWKVPVSLLNHHTITLQVEVTAINGYQLTTPMSSPPLTFTPSC